MTVGGSSVTRSHRGPGLVNHQQMISCFLPAPRTAQPPQTRGRQLLDENEFNCKWISHWQGLGDASGCGSPDSVSDGLGLGSGSATFSHRPWASCLTFQEPRDLPWVVNLPRATYAKANAIVLIRSSRAVLSILMGTEWNKNIFITAAEGSQRGRD